MSDAKSGYQALKDPRVVRRLNRLLPAILLTRSVRLNLPVQTLPYGRAETVKSAEMALFLAEAHYSAHVLFARFRDEVVGSLPGTAPCPPARQTRGYCGYHRFRAHETMCENLKRDLNMDELMVRDRLAVERLLWAAAMAIWC